VIYHPGKWISAPGKSRFFVFDTFDAAKIAFDDWHFVEPIELWQVAYIGKLLRTDLVALIGGEAGFSPIMCRCRFWTFWRIFPPRNANRLFEALPAQLSYAPWGTMTAKRIKLLKLLKKGGQKHEGPTLEQR